MEPFVLGWREWVALPELGLPAVKAKIDTGARTSALHAFSIETFGPIDAPRVRFGVHPADYSDDIEIWCTAKIVDRRMVRSSNGQAENRFIIETPIKIGDREWPIEISLSNRYTMAHRMLLGRTALEGASATILPWSEYRQAQLSYDVYGEQAGKPKKRSLRIALLTMEPGNFSNRRLIEETEKRDHVIEPINTLRCYMNIKSIASAVHYEGKTLPDYDFVIPRIGASITAYGTAVVRQFEMTGACVLNSAQSIVQSRDKLFAHQLLAMHKLPMPDTAFASSHHDTDDLIKMVGGAPLVIKLLQSSQGKGVVLAENRKSAVSLIDALRSAETSFLVQQFISEAAGQDLRCIVLDGKVIAAMVRRAAGDEFRANLHKGGLAFEAKLTAEERKLAIKAAHRLGLKFAGVDILRSSKGPLLLEVNSSPGLEGVERTTGVDVAGLVLDYIEQRSFGTRPRMKKAA
ncbi:30S ribosomal protein S6 modification protein RimK [Rhodomicrobium udaipurense JA643]|uniref:30S ribosomal protein S6--L-glutamate ligase n=1 Tax=Rhodomicrobium udaipurense TaxID=1202716 RepID=A0A8I1GGT3_9HYPH|nr:30S ribosomal protein S6--L-glutamate ligase [Rhodomicrobium udaipurense]KAI95263.1 30S ribosomal protein S6 modification protein RimK [Rhodomicrobium udaipurense JA643]MBJ7542662.1 30S ribosomal protein S6--L-glutamate ligase [Rhodomicrobium udaipurense]